MIILSHRMLLPVFCLIVALCFTACGCSPLKLDHDADAFARSYLNLIVEKDYESVYQYYTPQLKEIVTQEKNTEILDRLNSDYGPFQDLTVKEYSFFTRTLHTAGKEQKIETITINYELSYHGKHALYVVHLHRNGSGFLVNYWKISMMKYSLFEINRLSFGGKGIVHYLFLLAMVGEVIFILYIIVLSARSKLKRKYIWCILSIVGACSVSMNWFTGSISLNILCFQLLLGVSWSCTVNGLVLTFTFPLGAFLALMKMRSKRIEEAKALARLEPR